MLGEAAPAFAVPGLDRPVEAALGVGPVDLAGEAGRHPGLESDHPWVDIRAIGHAPLRARAPSSPARKYATSSYVPSPSSHAASSRTYFSPRARANVRVHSTGPAGDSARAVQRPSSGWNGPQLPAPDLPVVRRSAHGSPLRAPRVGRRIAKMAPAPGRVEGRSAECPAGLRRAPDERRGEPSVDPGPVPGTMMAPRSRRGVSRRPRLRLPAARERNGFLPRAGFPRPAPRRARGRVAG